MTDFNPYQASHQFDPASAFSPFDITDFQISEPYIVCGPQVLLPEVCVLTGATSNLVSVRKSVTVRPFRFTWTQLQCEVTFSLARVVYDRHRLFERGALLLLGGLVTLVFAMFFSSLFLCAVAGVCMAAGAVLSVIGAFTQVKLFVIHHDRHRVFWLEGFAPPFFEQVQRLRFSSSAPHGSDSPDLTQPDSNLQTTYGFSGPIFDQK